LEIPLPISGSVPSPSLSSSFLLCRFVPYAARRARNRSFLTPAASIEISVVPLNSNSRGAPVSASPKIAPRALGTLTSKSGLLNRPAHLLLPSLVSSDSSGRVIFFHSTSEKLRFRNDCGLFNSLLSK
jgi:hypothetical protein